MNKKAVSIAVNLFVLLVVLLLVATLFYFITENNRVDLQFTQSVLATQVYERSYILEDYLQSVVEKSAKDCDSKEEFVNNFIDEMYFGKKDVDLFLIDSSNHIYFPEFSEIVSQVKEERVIINEVDNRKEFIIEFDFLIEDQLTGKEKSFFLVEDKSYRSFLIQHNFVKSFSGLS